MTLTRRDFLFVSAALAVSGAWAAPLPREADIVVIGAGAAIARRGAHRGGERRC